eukprot:1876016-Pyramimonas_sp.AAC.1
MVFVRGTYWDMICLLDVGVAWMTPCRRPSSCRGSASGAPVGMSASPSNFVTSWSKPACG